MISMGFEPVFGKPPGRGGKGLVNCWEFHNCPKDRQQICSAFTTKAGRTCWRVAGTLCGGKAQGIIAQKIGDCQKCDFYIQVTGRQL